MGKETKFSFPVNTDRPDSRSFDDCVYDISWLIRKIYPCCYFCPSFTRANRRRGFRGCVVWGSQTQLYLACLYCNSNLNTEFLNLRGLSKTGRAPLQPWLPFHYKQGPSNFAHASSALSSNPRLTSRKVAAQIAKNLCRFTFTFSSHLGSNLNHTYAAQGLIRTCGRVHDGAI